MSSSPRQGLSDVPSPLQQGLGGDGTKLGLAAALFNHVDLGLVGAHLKCWRGKEAETSFWTGDSPGIERQNYESSHRAEGWR